MQSNVHGEVPTGLRRIRAARWWMRLMAMVLWIPAVSCVRTPEMPALDGASVAIVRSSASLSRGDPRYAETLQILWFGSACHEIRLGDLSVVTDPFVTNGLKLRNLVSDPQRVGETLEKLPPPAAVIVNHSHHDHLLDAHAALALPEWRKYNVPLFGSRTCCNLLAAWNDKDVSARCHEVRAGETPVDWNSSKHPGLPAGYRLRISAFRGAHNPHLPCGKVLMGGSLEHPPEKPDSVFDYPCGEVLNYLLDMTSPGGSNFKVVFLGGPGDPSWIPKGLGPVDVVITPTPGVGYLDGHLVRHLEILRPRHIVLNHFNNFFAGDAGPANPKTADPDERTLPIDFPKVTWLSRELQKHYIAKQGPDSGFESLHIPSLSRMVGHGRARNVILIGKPGR